MSTRRLLAPYARVKIGETQFEFGDGILQSASVTLAEGEASSSCQFGIYDPTRKYANEYFAFIFENDGLDPIQDPREKTQNVAGSSGTLSGDLAANERAFLDVIAFAEGSDYNVMFTGRTFNSYERHPDEVICSGGLCSSAAGRYQFLTTTWEGLGLPDFTPQNQDKGALVLIDQEGALEDVRAGRLEDAVTKCNNVWASFPGSPYGQPTKTMTELRSYFDERVRYYGIPGSEASTKAAESTQKEKDKEEQEPKSKVWTPNGGQITIELGYNGQVTAAYSFIHTSLEFDIFNPHLLLFGGQSVAWVLTQRVKNTAYVNLSFKGVAQRICDRYGITLEMPVEGPRYEYFPIRGRTEYEALVIEARRIGYRVYSYGKKLIIKPREANEIGFVLEYGDNMGLTFNVSHSAQSSSSGGARASSPSDRTSTGEMKYTVDPDTGEVKQVKAENATGTGAGAQVETTGAATPKLKPKTTGATDKEDEERSENEKRIKGVIASWEAPTTPELLTVNPDSVFMTKGICEALDRVWVVESITHSVSDSGFSTTGTCYSPLKNKYPSQIGSGSISGSSLGGGIPGSNPDGYINPMPEGVVTSRYRTASRPGHNGIDLGAPVGTPIYASAPGIVELVAGGCIEGDRACNGRAGNYLTIRHPDGRLTRYLHLSQFNVTQGTQVPQGALIGLCGNSGDSSGPHLHWEIRDTNGAALNPENFVTF